MNSELNELKNAEQEISGKAWIGEFARRVGALPPEERAYRLIRTYLQSEQTGGKVDADFLIWLCSDHNAEAKERAMRRALDETSGRRL
jgi:hypothetical protein